jgi:hypothetical protein
MSVDPQQIGVNGVGDEAFLRATVKRVAIIVPVVAVSLGAAASMADRRLGLFAAAVVIGWTQLVGL